MADLTLSANNPSTVKAEALVIASAITPDGLSIATQQLPDEFVATIEKLAVPLGITGAADEIRRLPAVDGIKAKTVVVTGLGKPQDDGTFGTETLRRAAGAAVRELAGTTTVAVALPNANEDDVNAIAEGALLGAYAYNAYRTKDAKAAVQKLEVLSAGARSERAKVAIKRAEVVAEAVHGARDLVNTPPNVLYPETFVEAARSAVKDSGAKNIAITVLDEKALISGGFGGIAGVGQGSDRPPRLVKLAYTPAGATQHVGLVGKGITYDSGGISLKPGSSLHTMTLDMAGAAAVLQTIVAAARLAVPVAVTGYLCLAENMPGGHAMRPDDVLTMRSGTTVEVTNTDAEGRLVMADGIAEAVNDGVDIVLDIATLTGAQMIALGSRVSAVMGDDDIRSGVVDAAKACGEEFWPMPLTPDTKAGLKSKIADLLNTPSTRYGGMLAAGWFLEAFRGETPWAHLDIAGPAYNEGAAFGYTPQLATGVGVRTLLTYLESLA